MSLFRFAGKARRNKLDGTDRFSVADQRLSG